MNGHIDIGNITPSRYFFSIAVFLGLLFAMISTDKEKYTALFFLQWQLQAVVPMALLIVTHTVLLSTRFIPTINPWLALVISGVFGSTMFAPIGFLFDLWLETEALESLTDELINEWVNVVPPLTLSWLALNAPWLFGYRLERKTSTEINASEPVERPNDSLLSENTPEFIKLVPLDKQGRLILLKSELHYLKVVTEKGSTLILYNLGDAIDQLPSGNGISVHRSYWVALDAIDCLVQQGRQGELRLHDGQLVPVSRSRLPEVRATLADR